MVAMSGTSLPKIRIGLAAGFSILKILKRNLPDGFFWRLFDCINTIPWTSVLIEELQIPKELRKKRQ